MEWNASYDDLAQVRQFARGVDVITFEFENVPSATTAAAEEFAPVRPHGEVLHTTQHRLREKQFLRDNGFPLPRFAPVRSMGDLLKALDEMGTPAVLKTAGWGYDGKGQCKINEIAQAESAWKGLGGVEGVLEEFVDFAHEVSVVAARGMDGSFAHYGVMENIHKHHILDITLSPGRVGPEVERAAVEIAHGILDSLGVVGMLCVEFFLTRNGSLLVNELAPRPHNSGHITFDNRVTNQFEQQLRAICGLPLGSTELLRPGVMVNLLGDVWSGGEPNWAAACAFSNVKLHLYGKADARPGRKMGHLNVLGHTVDAALEEALKAREALTRQA